MNCLANVHDWRLVGLAVVVCVLASLAAVSMFQRARMFSGAAGAAWMAGAGVATGSGVWATHFIAMLAFNPGLPIVYDVPLTAVSLAVAIGIVTVGFAFAIHVRHPRSALVGGGIAGLGIVAMHYLGMAALDVGGQAVWSADLVVSSIVIAVAFGAAALDRSSRAVTWRGLGAAALLLALATVGLHFTAMAAVGYIPEALHPLSESAVSPVLLSLGIAAVAGIVLCMCLVGVLSDRRAQREIAEQNQRLDATINNMSQGLCMFDAQNRLMIWNERYRVMYGIAPGVLRVGMTVRDLLQTRIRAGTFPLDPARYEADLHEALKRQAAYRMNIDLADGRTMHVVNQPMTDGGWVATHEDITERRRAEHELGRTRMFLDSIIRNVPTPVMVKELPGMTYALVNKAAEKFIGVPAEVLIGKTVHDVLEKGTAERVHQRDLAMLSSKDETVSDEYVVVTPNGDRIVTSIRVPLADENGNPKYMICLVHDLTQRKRDEAKISYMAEHDPLTDLPNRAAFADYLTAVTSERHRPGEGIALLALDLDRFQDVNDIFGHGMGDSLLRLVARRLEQSCEGAFIARIGGDEFAVISPVGPQPATGEVLAESLAATMSGDFVVDGTRLETGVTIGVAIYPADATDSSALIANADAALHRAKAEARGTIRFFEHGMDEKLRQRRALQLDLRSAIAHDELSLAYQPLARINGEITGFEALARWHHPLQGVVSPAVFIPLAEDSGLIGALGEWVIRTACREAAAWPRPLDISVNLSPAQFQHGDLVSLVHGILLETGLPPARLQLEVTEGVFMQDFSRGLGILRRLKALGVRIAMDDFGTGYSSLSYLQAFPFDKIKIDQSFTRNLGDKPQAAAIVRAVIGLAHGLDLPVLAEGVETEEQRLFLRSAGCDEIQGYLIGKPQSVSAYDSVLGRVPARKAVAAAG